MPDWEPRPGETPVDPSGLKNIAIRTRRELFAAEAENIRKATVHYLAARPDEKSAPFTYEWMLEVHRRMFDDVWDWAGIVRQKNVTIGIDFSLIDQQLGGLALDIRAWQLQDDLLIEQSARLHHTAVFIHPFENGNGRWSRMLANIWLRRHGSPVIAWPESLVGSVESPIRNEYLQAVRLADTGDRSGLEASHERYRHSP